MELSVPLSTAAESPAAHSHCLNCAAPLHDQYCARCGQPANTHRFQTSHLLHEIPHSIWHVDKGLLYTLGQLLRRPGAAIRSYLAGQRRAHFAPVSYLLLLTGVAAFLMAALHIMPFDMHDPGVSDSVRQTQLHIFGPVLKYMSWLNILALPATALLTRGLLRRGGFNYAECVIINAFVVGTGTVVSLLSMPFLYYWSGLGPVGAVQKTTTVLTLLLHAWMYGQLLNHTALSAAGRYWRGLLLSIGNYVLTIMLIVVLMVSTNWSFIKQQLHKQHPKTPPAVSGH